MRIGHGYDVHRFGKDDFIALSGVRVPHKHELTARSGDDVLLHTLSDTLLGATALGDVSKHSPGTDSRFKDADNCTLLRHVVAIVAERSWKVGNVDATIVAQVPKMAPHIETMHGSIAEDLGAAADQVSVKTATTERLGFTGREEDIAVHAVTLLMAR